MYKILGNAENTKTKQNHIGMYDQKPQHDQLMINEVTEMTIQ